MLLFELFPAFVLIVSFVAGVALFIADRRARHQNDEGHDLEARPIPPRRVDRAEGVSRAAKVAVIGYAHLDRRSDDRRGPQGD